MTASRQPARRRTRIHWLKRSRPTHCIWSTSLARSAQACPENAAHTTFRPAARAPRATSTGNTPSPAINPNGSVIGGGFYRPPRPTERATARPAAAGAHRPLPASPPAEKDCACKHGRKCGAPGLRHGRRHFRVAVAYAQFVEPVDHRGPARQPDALEAEDRVDE